MISYLTKTGNLIYHYDRTLDNHEEALRAALVKHNLINARVTSIGVTRQTDFIKKHVNVNRSKALTVNSLRLTPPPYGNE